MSQRKLTSNKKNGRQKEQQPQKTSAGDPHKNIAAHKSGRWPGDVAGRQDGWATLTPGKQLDRQPSHKLEALWDDLLSRQTERVQQAYLRLDMPEREAVFAHLQRMLTEPGWQAEQRASAKAAIHALERLAR